MKKRIVALLLVLILASSTAIALAATYYRVNTTSLKCRVLPQDNSEVKDSFRTDFALRVQKKYGNWSYVIFSNGVEGYVYNRYISKGSSYKAYITNDDTPIRTGPDYSFSNVGTLAKGTKVSVLTHGKKYDYVKSSIGYGYVLNARLSKKYVKPSGSANKPAYSSVDYTAWIANNGKRVNLRTEPSDKASIINSYADGTMVQVYEHGPVWDFVEVNGDYGYMMTSLLSKYAPAPTEIPVTPTPFASYTAYVTSTNQKQVNVRKGAGLGYAVVFNAQYGSKVTVLADLGAWKKIRQGSLTGYIKSEFIQLSEPDPIIAPVPTPTPEPDVTPEPWTPYYATITCPAGEKVNVRSGEGQGYTHLARLDPGTVVYVVAQGKKYPKSWVKIEVNGITGYVMKKFLQ